MAAMTIGTVGNRGHLAIVTGQGGSVSLGGGAMKRAVLFSPAACVALVVSLAVPAAASEAFDTGGLSAGGAAVFQSEAGQPDQRVIMPDIVGMTEADALATLEMVGLVVSERTIAVSEGAPDRTVVAQDPVAGMEVAIGSAVAYSVVDAAASPSPSDVGGGSDAAQPGDASSGQDWDAFKDRLGIFIDEADVMAFYRATRDQDDEVASSLAAQLHDSSVAAIAWLDANPPAACYAASWEAFRGAADRLATAMDTFSTEGLDAASDPLMSAGEALVDAGGTIMDSGEACRAAAGGAD